MIRNSTPNSKNGAMQHDSPVFKGMNAIQQLLTGHIDIWTAADTAKKSGPGRSSGNAASVYGIKKLRELILELAVRGKLVPQDANDEPASELLKRIQGEKAQLVAEGKIKKDKPLPVISENEKLFTLPNGWEWERLGRAVYIEMGQSPDSINYNQNGEGIPFFQGKADFGPIFPSERYWCTKPTKYAFDGDILLSVRAPVGPTNIATKECCIGRGLAALRPLAELSTNYLLTTMRAFENVLRKCGTGTTFSAISRDDIDSFVVPIPPIFEQLRIVAKVDELMALCDQLETQHNNAAEAHEKLVSHLLGTLTQSQNAGDLTAREGGNAGNAGAIFGQPDWQRIAAHFDTLFTTEASIDALKQTLLQLAVMGKLVAQDPNDEPASELLKRIQAEKARLIAEGKIKQDKPLAAITEEEKSFDLPQGWAWVKPGEFSIKITDGEHFRPPTEEKGIYFLSAKDVREEGVSLADPLFISEETAKKALQRCNPEYGDLLIVSRGATVGRMCKVNIQEKFCLLGSVILVKPTTLVLSDYLSISLKSPSSFSLLINASGSTAQPAIYLKDLKEITLSLPPIEEQHRIVAKVDELMSLCDQLKSRLTEASHLQLMLADVMVERAISQ
jgi:type I restriction enzyme, S subunit